ncbi:hypothetical protein OG689_10790 [Kitasatospora sp. NBC_00240]|uniref:hypothetical protein n=1 Tax=Kitasatospora sp. NBC_00240 TaxID=2903567 RepID=UPI002252AFA8|nr:hypothetical protein [Kitasatospora sp. NBC_00240]MCX5209770.1 hypothetical protein [Kitasatospora sp. NBC_00240]
MTTIPLTDEQLTEIRARHERTTHPDWRATTDVGRLLAEVTRLREENKSLAADAAVTRADRRDRAAAMLQQIRFEMAEDPTAAKEG